MEALDILGFEKIARDEDRNIHAYKGDPVEKWDSQWVFCRGDGDFLELPNENFATIQWTDEEPLNIKEALKWLK